MKLALNRGCSVSVGHPLGKVNPLFEYWMIQSTEVRAAERIQKPVGQTSEIFSLSKSGVFLFLSGSFGRTGIKSDFDHLNSSL